MTAIGLHIHQQEAGARLNMRAHLSHEFDVVYGRKDMGGICRDERIVTVGKLGHRSCARYRRRARAETDDPMMEENGNRPPARGGRSDEGDRRGGPERAPQPGAARERWGDRLVSCRMWAAGSGMAIF